MALGPRRILGVSGPNQSGGLGSGRGDQGHEREKKAGGQTQRLHLSRLGKQEPGQDFQRRGPLAQ